MFDVDRRLVAAVALLVACATAPLHGAKASSEQIVYAFKAKPRSAHNPSGALLRVGNELYGETYFGTTCPGNHEQGHQCGTIYSLHADGHEKQIYSFSGVGGLPRSATNGLTELDGIFYGVSNGGDLNACNLAQTTDCGIIFSLTKQGVLTVLHSFLGGSDGANPTSPLLAYKGTLYGTGYGGAGSTCTGCGVIFSITPAGVYTVLHTFNLFDGKTPSGALTNIENVLYGTTFQGGNHCESEDNFGCGTAYKITTDGKFKTIHNFDKSPNGYFPVGGFTLLNGVFYGTALAGGLDYGTVFSMTSTGAVTVLHQFVSGQDGQNPNGPLLALNGSLYGVTIQGGDGKGCGKFGCGTVFSITPNGAETILHQFAGVGDGIYPDSQLTAMGSLLYGTTTRGGTVDTKFCPNGCGVVYSITP